MRSALGLLALQSFPGIGELVALQHALLASEFDPYVDEHAELWTQGLLTAEEEIERCREMGISVITIFEDAYPTRLRTIHNPPPVIYVKGNHDLFGSGRSVAFGSARNASATALKDTEGIIAALASRDWGLIGGLSKGIQITAQRAAIRNGISSVAVLSSGFARVAVKDQELVDEVLESGGAVLGSFRLDFEPTSATSEGASRIETALAVALILTQAGKSDPAMRAVRSAAKQGRPVFATSVQDDAELDEGKRILLETPVAKLPQVLPAWKRREFFAESLGDQPLIRPLDLGNVDELLETLERIPEGKGDDPFEPLTWTAISGRGRSR